MDTAAYATDALSAAARAATLATSAACAADDAATAAASIAMADVSASRPCFPFGGVNELRPLLNKPAILQALFAMEADYDGSPAVRAQYKERGDTDPHTLRAAVQRRVDVMNVPTSQVRIGCVHGYTHL